MDRRRIEGLAPGQLVISRFDPGEFLARVRDFRGDYGASKAFSRQLDETLGYRKSEIEAELVSGPACRAELVSGPACRAERVKPESHPARHAGSETVGQGSRLARHAGPDTRPTRHVGQGSEQRWIGLNPDALETPYPELHEALSVLNLNSGFHLVDLGAGYGRAAFVLHALQPEASFTGFEIVSERAQEANRVFALHGLNLTSRVLTQDLGSPEFRLPTADVYFIYDLGTVARIRATLETLRAQAAQGPVIVIGRGRATRNLIENENPWLAAVHPATHFTNLSVYRSAV